MVLVAGVRLRSSPLLCRIRLVSVCVRNDDVVDKVDHDSAG
jgi:hypothetical protein